MEEYFTWIQIKYVGFFIMVFNYWLCG